MNRPLAGALFAVGALTLSALGAAGAAQAETVQPGNVTPNPGPGTNQLTITCPHPDDSTLNAAAVITFASLAPVSGSFTEAADITSIDAFATDTKSPYEGARLDHRRVRAQPAGGWEPRRKHRVQALQQCHGHSDQTRRDLRRIGLQQRQEPVSFRRPGVPRKQTLRATPTGAHLHSAGPSRRPTFGAVSCANGVTGYWIDPNNNNNSTHDFALVPGSEIDVPTNGPGVWQFFINQPNALEAKGPALDSDRSFEFAVQRVNEAVVNTDGGRQSIYWNDEANAFSFHAVSDFHLYYLCGNGRA
jgi:hypothetical protein